MNINYKKIRNSLFLTLLMFSVGAFCVFSTTTSKYFAFKDSHLVYNVKYKQITKKQLTLKVDSASSFAPETLGLVATFYRSNYVLDTDENVKYTFEIDPACKLTKVLNSNGTLNKDDNTLIYSKPNIKSDLDNKIEVYFTCNAEAIREEDSLNTKFSVTEQFKANGASSYENKVYDLGNISISYSGDDFTPQPGIKDDVLYIPKTYTKSIYDYITKKFLTGDEINYFKSKYKADDSNILIDGLLPGFVVSEDGDYYTYSKTKNFTSYAFTYKSNGAYFWFLSKSSTNLELISLLSEYLDMYTTYTTEEKSALISYITNSSTTLKELLACTDNSKNINGVYYSSNRWIRFGSDIWLYINPPEKIEINYSDDQSAIVDIILNDLPAAFNFVSNDNMTKIKRDIGTPIVEKPSNEKYTYLGPYNDGSQTVVALVHAVPADAKEYISIYEVKPSQDYVLSFVKASTDTETVTNINTVLGYFGSDVVITEAMLNDPDSNDMIEITFDGTINISFVVPGSVSESTSATVQE